MIHLILSMNLVLYSLQARCRASEHDHASTPGPALHEPRHAARATRGHGAACWVEDWNAGIINLYMCRFVPRGFFRFHDCRVSDHETAVPVVAKQANSTG